MSISNAKIFLKKIQEEDEFRSEFYVVNNEKDFVSILEKNQIPFSSSELDEAFNNRLANCQTEEQADALYNALNFYKIIVSAFK